MRGQQEEAQIFPRSRCVAIAAELNAWTSVQAVLAAARHLEGRSLPTDEIESLLIMPMPHGPLFEAVFLRAMSWLTESYSVPTTKIVLARALDRSITHQTAEQLTAARFSPTIKRGPLKVFDTASASPPDGPCVFLVEDKPIIIEMLQAPLQCLMDILTFSFEAAERLCKLQVEAKATTSGAFTVFHRPYAESRLHATLEALCYYAFGLSIGPYHLSADMSEIDVSYRAVNVRSRPPLDATLVGHARKMMEGMLNDIR